MTAARDRLRDPRQRADRAGRILDATAALLLRHGYRRVTVDDVAAAAGIGKGTVYLHWKSRDELFGAVLGREVLRAVDELAGVLRREPETCLLHRFARVYFLAVVRRPLLCGLLLDDAELLGRLTARRDGEQHELVSRRYLELLAGHGLLVEADVDGLGYAFQATFEGFLRAPTAPYGPEARADLLADTVRRAFERGRPVPESTLRSLAAEVAALLAGLAEADRADRGGG